MIHVLIVDDHPVIRRGLRDILEVQSGMHVDGEASNGEEALALIQRQSWDVVLLDVTMPGRNGLEVLRDIHEQYPALPVLMLSLHPEDHYAMRALKAGASGYLTKDSTPEELVSAIQRVLQGKRYITPTLAERLANEVGAGGGRNPHELLSDREFQVLCQLGQLKTVTQIAEAMSLSVKTISTYRARILEKLGMKQTADLIRYAREHRLVE